MATNASMNLGRNIPTQFQAGDTVFERLGTARSTWYTLNDTITIIDTRPDGRYTIQVLDHQSGSTSTRVVHANSIIPVPDILRQSAIWDETNNRTVYPHAVRLGPNDEVTNFRILRAPIDLDANEWQVDVGDPSTMRATVRNPYYGREAGDSPARPPSTARQVQNQRASQSNASPRGKAADPTTPTRNMLGTSMQDAGQLAASAGRFTSTGQPNVAHPYSVQHPFGLPQQPGFHHGSPVAFGGREGSQSYPTTPAMSSTIPHLQPSFPASIGGGYGLTPWMSSTRHGSPTRRPHPAPTPSATAQSTATSPREPTPEFVRQLSGAVLSYGSERAQQDSADSRQPGGQTVVASRRDSMASEAMDIESSPAPSPPEREVKQEGSDGAAPGPKNHSW